MTSDLYYENVELLRIILGTYGNQITVEQAVDMIKYINKELGVPPEPLQPQY